MEPIIKWTGGKRWLVETVRPVWEKAGRPRIVEPFCGGAAISLGLEPKEAVLCDANKELINFYGCVRLSPVWNYDIGYARETYLHYRALFNHVMGNPNESWLRAQLFYYLNQHDFNSLWRVNKQGFFNVPPRPGTGTLKLPDTAAFFQMLRGWTLQADDWQRAWIRAGDFVFADPPYDVGFTAYTAQAFAWIDQERLATWLSCHDGTVMATNAATRRVLDLYHSLGFDGKILESKQAMQRAQGRSDRVPEALFWRNCSF